MEGSRILVVVPLLVAVVDVIAAAAVLWGARDRRLALPFALFAIASAPWLTAISLQAIPGSYTRYPEVVAVGRYGFIFIPAAAAHVAVTWTAPHRRLLGWGVLAGYATSTAFALAHWQGMLFAGMREYRWGAMGRPGSLYPLFVVFMCAALLSSIPLAARAYRRSTDPAERLRMRYLFVAVGVSVPIGLTNFLPNYGFAVPPIGVLGHALFMIIVCYAIVCHRLLDLDAATIKAMAAAGAALMVTLPLAGVLVLAWRLGFDLSGPVVLPVIALTAAGAAAFFSRLRTHFEHEVELSLFPARRAGRQAIESFSRRVVELSHHDVLGRDVVDTLRASLNLNGVAFYVRAPASARFLRESSSGAIAAPEEIEADDAGRAAIDSDPERTVILSHRGNDLPFGWEALVPIRADDETRGVIVLGSKNSGGAFADDEQTLLAVLASQVAIALRNAEYVRSLEIQRAKIEAQKTRLEELQGQLQRENVFLRAEIHSVSAFREIIGSSASLRQELTVVERTADSQAPVLITGETGTGKELVARAIHELSRRPGPLVSVNCPAVPHDLAEATFFGYERGAFTGALEAQPGKFELADGGTIFLDEVAELSPALQTKLLRTLQDHQTQRLGGRQVRKLDLRVIAATNRDLQAEIAAGRFRGDLYYRLAAVVVTLPPLRERIDDISMLASFFLDRAAAAHNKKVRGFGPEAMKALRAYHWPGNIRELQNVVERAVLLCTSEIVRVAHLSDLATPRASERHLAATIRTEKERRVRQALAHTGGNQAAAARLLGMTPSNLGRLMKNLGMR